MTPSTASGANLKNYILVTLAYWGFTITDGALRMLVLLYFDSIGYTPLQIAFLFLFYEIIGVITNLLGGWIGSQLGAVDGGGLCDGSPGFFRDCQRFN